MSGRESWADDSPKSDRITGHHRLATDDRLYVIRSHPGRWHPSTVAAGLSADGRCYRSVQEWIAVLDDLDVTIRARLTYGPATT